MMQEILTINEFNLELEKLKKLIHFPEPFPMFNLVIKPKKVRFLDFNYLFESSFFQILLEYSKLIGETGFGFITLEPNPIDSYYKNFNSFASAKFTINDSFEDLGNLVFKKRNNTNETIRMTLSSIALLSKSNSWVIYGDYNSDLAIFASFLDSEANKIFSHPCFMVTQEAADWLKKINYKINLDAFKRSWVL